MRGFEFAAQIRSSGGLTPHTPEDDFGWGWSIAAFAGFASMFRNPLKYFYARARGHDVEVPK